MGEKGVHAVLKRFYQPDVNAQEIRVERCVADAVTGDGSSSRSRRPLCSAAPKARRLFL
ncbi:MAG: hypothetical protein ACLU9S_21240 [Oscillospiraceae bacterium]